MNDQATTGILDGFQTVLVASWRRLPNKVFFFALLGVWLALFQFFGNATFGYVDTPSLFQWIANVCTVHLPDGSLTDDNLSLWIPVIVLSLFWWKREELIGLAFRTWWPGLSLVLCGMVLHMAGYIAQQPRISIAAMFVGIYGLTGVAWGPAWLRKSFFPYFLFIFCIPFSALLEPVTFPLRLLVTRIVEWICHFVLAIDVVRQGTQLRDPAGHYQYEVAAACSGIRSLVAIGLMATIGAFLCFKEWWRRGVLIASVVPLAVVGNAVRLLTIIVSAEVGGQKAGDYVHEGGPMGVISLLPYVPAFFGLLALGKWLKEPKESDPKPL